MHQAQTHKSFHPLCGFPYFFQTSVQMPANMRYPWQYHYQEPLSYFFCSSYKTSGKSTRRIHNLEFFNIILNRRCINKINVLTSGYFSLKTIQNGLLIVSFCQERNVSVPRALAFLQLSPGLHPLQIVFLHWHFLHWRSQQLQPEGAVSFGVLESLHPTVEIVKDSNTKHRCK